MISKVAFGLSKCSGQESLRQYWSAIPVPDDSVIVDCANVPRDLVNVCSYERFSRCRGISGEDNGIHGMIAAEMDLMP